MTQNNLGSALPTLGERESGTARLEEAVAAYRAALQERTRERVPLDWAGTQTISATRSGRWASGRQQPIKQRAVWRLKRRVSISRQRWRNTGRLARPMTWAWWKRTSRGLKLTLNGSADDAAFAGPAGDKPIPTALPPAALL